MLRWVSGQLPPWKIAPWLGLGFGSRLGLVLGLGVNQTTALQENSPPVRVRTWVKVSFGVGWQFSSEAIVLEPLRWCILIKMVHASWQGIL